MFSAFKSIGTSHAVAAYFRQSIVRRLTSDGSETQFIDIDLIFRDRMNVYVVMHGIPLPLLHIIHTASRTASTRWFDRALPVTDHAHICGN